MQLERGEVIDTFNVWVDKSRLVFVASSVCFFFVDRSVNRCFVFVVALSLSPLRISF